MPEPRPASYDDEEVREILRRALAEDEGLTHDELAAAAAEVGIESDRFERAAAEVRSERSSKSFEEAVARRKKKRVRAIARSGAVFTVLGVFLYLVNVLAGGALWFQWPALAMGLLLALRVIGHLFADDEEAVRKEEAKRAKRLRRADCEERRRRKATDRRSRSRSRSDRLRSAETVFEAAVEEGLARLLESIARGIAPARDAEGGGELADFIARKEGRPRRQRPPKAAEASPAGPAIRVSVDDEGEAEVREAMAELERELRR